MRASLNGHVYGQHLVTQTVPAAVTGHLKYPPEKALVMAFQGTTGTGKNLVAKLVAESMFEQGMKSQYVHVLSGTKDFSRHELVKDYKVSVYIINNTTEIHEVSYSLWMAL